LLFEAAGAFFSAQPALFSDWPLRWSHRAGSLASTMKEDSRASIGGVGGQAWLRGWL